MRMHIELDDRLAAEVDEIAGARGRSAFVRAAITRAVSEHQRWEHLTRAAGAIVKWVRRPGGETGRAPLALGDRLRLDPVLAEGGEVDHQIGGVEDVLAND